MIRERLLTIYCLLAGSSGWIWLTATPFALATPAELALFAFLALFVESLGVRTPPSEWHSLVGLVLIGAALALSPAAGALIAALEGLVFGILSLFLSSGPRDAATLIARPLLCSGARALGILAGAALAALLLGGPAASPAQVLVQPAAAGAAQFGLLLCIVPCYVLIIQALRAGREYLQGGSSGVRAWWGAAWRLIVLIEIVPLPLAVLLAAVYTNLALAYFVLASIALVTAGGVVRRATRNLRIQRRSVRELALLNEVSRAIIRSELSVEALCDLIYREASRIVDASSFHLGLFDGDTYTLHVRVQDRVRLPPLTVHLEPGDGLIGWIRQTGRALLVEDFVEEMDRLPARPRYQSERPPRAGIYVPLISGDTVIGSLSVQSYQPRSFDANDLRLLSLIADQAAVAITRARAFNETRQRALQLQAIHEVSERVTAILNLEELLPSVVRLIHERFQYHPVHIFTLEPDSDLIVFRASTAIGEGVATRDDLSLRIGQGIVGNAVASGQPLLVGDVLADPRYIPDDSHTRSELAVPLKIGDQVIGVLDVQSDQPADFDADDLFVMRTLADQIAIAIDSANSYAAQQEEAWTLNALLQIAENIGRATTIDELLPTIVRLPPLLVGCDRCLCLIWERDAERFTCLAAYGLSRHQRAQLVGRQITAAEAPLLAEVRDELRPLRLNHAQQYPDRCLPLIELCGSGTLVVLPILARASLLAVLLLDFDQPGYVPNQRQAALYAGAASQVAGALESALLAQEAAEAARLEQELRVAREIQTALLPARTPAISGWEIAADWRSARLVGGDFYDFWQLRQRDKRLEIGDYGSVPVEQQARAPQLASPVLGFVIADVSDKGVPAAMFMALARSLVRAAALDGSPPATALTRANRWINRDSESGMFVTLFYGLLDTSTGQLQYCCAGHNPPLLFRATTRRFELLATPGIALGVLEEVDLHEAATQIDPGDMLVCYTDGLTEAINEREEQFGTERLRALVARHQGEGAEETLRALTRAVTIYTSGQPPFDDVTLVVIKRNA